MSNGRTHRRRIAAGNLRAQLTAAEADAPTVVFGAGRGDGTLMQPIKVGRILYMVAIPPAGASDDLLAAYSARATASITGRCPACGAKRHVRQRGHIGAAAFLHEHDCPVSDDRIVEPVHQERAS
jgi:hypothetical protein